MRWPYPSIEFLECRIAPAVIVVTNPLDSTVPGKTNLRQALAMADSDLMAKPGVINTIIFKLPAAPAGTENIMSLTAGLLTSRGDVKIIGPGAGKFIIDAGGTSGVFSFADGTPGTDSPVSISGLTIEHGTAADAGGIVSTESLTLKNVVVSGNTSPAKTGGIEVDGDVTAGTKVSITSCLITGNTGHATGGVALYAVKSFAVTGSTISGNTNTNGFAGGFYAGIAAGGTGGSVSASRIIGNTAVYAAGLAFKDTNSAKTSVITVKNTTVSGNSTANTTAASGLGGGIMFMEGNDIISGCTIQGNTAQYDGGGVFGAYPASLAITHSTISGNRAITHTTSAQGGGGLFVEGSSATVLTPLKITGSSISNNTSGLDGGGALVGDGVALSITSSTFSGNIAASGNGGGLAAEGAGARKVDVTIASSKFINNSASAGGGIGAYGGGGTTGAGAVSISSSAFTGNFAASGGGLGINTTGAVTLKSITVVGNVSSTFGGGLDLATSQAVAISAGKFASNEALHGGGMWLANSAGSIDNATVTGNAALDDGGGIESSTSIFTLKGDHVLANSAPLGPDTYGTGLTVV